MKTLKSLVAAVVLTLVMSGTALSDQTPCNPGEVNTPPCVTAPVISEDPDSGQVNNAPPSDSFDIISLAEIALEALMLY